ncbi:fluoride efflux transporter CrcB [Geodermatophilus sp. SYSU D00684]
MRSPTAAYPLAAVGGALGALARWGVAEALPSPGAGWPWATLLVNLTGCLLMGVLLGLLTTGPEPAWVRPFLAVGVLGGYTTYSAFAVEVVELTDAGRVLLAAGYVLASVLGGVLATAAGLLAVRRWRP